MLKQSHYVINFKRSTRLLYSRMMNRNMSCYNGNFEITPETYKVFYYYLFIFLTLKLRSSIRSQRFL